MAVPYGAAGHNGLLTFDELTAEFLARDKIALRGVRWRTRAHPDYAVASMPVAVDGSRAFRGRIMMNGHRVRMPPKYCFSLIFRNQRILALDVNLRGRTETFLLPTELMLPIGRHGPQWTPTPIRAN